ncbi:MAG: type VI secretion system contractile sheath small subunit, partial [Acidobacteriia bacterium]|nr:type VI secretion system contractile sheath small subunit [Terriglobia bacterium]
MARSSSLASVCIDVEEEPRELPRPEPDTPFPILIVGDFSGGAGRQRAPIRVDRDNLDQALARLAPELRLPVGAAEVAIRFRELDDFHPDRMFERLEPFRALRDLRSRLADRATFAAAAAELAPPPPASQDPPPTGVSGADVLRMMMGDAPPPRPAAPREGEWDGMLRELVAPYLEPRPDPRQAVCYECHAPRQPDTNSVAAANNWGPQAGSGDDRTPMGVHAGLSCLSCHIGHGESARASCATCHPEMSHCGIDVEKMDT